MIRRLLIAALLSAPLAACQTAQQQPAARRFRMVYRIHPGQAVQHPAGRPPQDGGQVRPPDGGVQRPREGRLDRGRYRRAHALPRPARGPGDPLRRRRRPAGLLLEGHCVGWSQGRVAELVAHQDHGRHQAGTAALRRGRPRQPARRPRPLPAPERRRHALPHPRHQRALVASASRSPPAACAC